MAESKESSPWDIEGGANVSVKGLLYAAAFGSAAFFMAVAIILVAYWIER